MTRYLFVCLLICMGLSLPTLAQENLLANPSFEEGTLAPIAWTSLTKSLGSNYRWDSSTVYAGTKSLSTHGTRYRYGRWLSEPVAVESNGYTFYTLTGQVKTLHNIGEVYLSLAWLDENQHLIATSDSEWVGQGDNDWGTVSVTALVAPSAVWVSAWCLSNHNEGNTWFDALGLTVTQFPAEDRVSYEGFLDEYPGLHRC